MYGFYLGEIKLCRVYLEAVLLAGNV